MDEISVAGIPPVVGLLQGLEYGKPILGIRAPLGLGERDSGLCLPGLVIIQKASIEPSGEGIWKTALNPKLVLEKVQIEGGGREIGLVLGQLKTDWLGGVEIRGLEISWKTTGINHLQAEKALFEKKNIFLEKGYLRYHGKQTSVGELDLKIFQP